MLLHRVQPLGKAEVPEEDVIPGGEEHVLRLDVPVDHAPAVEVGHSAPHLSEYVTSAGLRKFACQEKIHFRIYICSLSSRDMRCYLGLLSL